LRVAGGPTRPASRIEFAAKNFRVSSYSEPRDGISATAVGRGTLNAAADGLDSFTVIFQQPAKPAKRITVRGWRFARDGRLFITMGERQRLAMKRRTSRWTPLKVAHRA
jgi:glucose/arabinose dehydrogenase